MKGKNAIFLFFNITIFLLKIKQLLLDDCPYDKPLLYGSKCYDLCSTYNFQHGCAPNNTLIITQWLNNIMPVSDAKYIYPDIVLMLNGDLIIGSNNPSIMNRQFFGIKKNGRPYFKNQLDDKETYYYSLDVEKTKYQSYKFSVKINDIEDENEYIINIAKDNSYNLELYDFDNDYTYQQKHNNFFKNYQVYNVRASVINNISDFNNSYFIL